MLWRLVLSISKGTTNCRILKQQLNLSETKQQRITRVTDPCSSLLALGCYATCVDLSYMQESEVKKLSDMLGIILLALLARAR